MFYIAIYHWGIFFVLYFSTVIFIIIEFVCI